MLYTQREGVMIPEETVPFDTSQSRHWWAARHPSPPSRAGCMCLQWGSVGGSEWWGPRALRRHSHFSLTVTPLRWDVPSLEVSSRVQFLNPLSSHSERHPMWLLLLLYLFPKELQRKGAGREGGRGETVWRNAWFRVFYTVVWLPAHTEAIWALKVKAGNIQCRIHGNLWPPVATTFEKSRIWCSRPVV